MAFDKPLWTDQPAFWTNQPIRLLYDVNRPDNIDEKQKPDVLICANDHQQKNYDILNDALNEFNPNRYFVEDLPFGKERSCEEDPSTRTLKGSVQIIGWDDPCSTKITTYINIHLIELYEKLGYFPALREDPVERNEKKKNYEYAWEILKLHVDEINLKKNMNFSFPPKDYVDNSMKLPFVKKFSEGVIDTKKALYIYKEENLRKSYPDRQRSLINTVKLLKPGDALECGAHHAFLFNSFNSWKEDAEHVENFKAALSSTGLWCAVICTEEQSKEIQLDNLKYLEENNKQSQELKEVPSSTDSGIRNIFRTITDIFHHNMKFNLPQNLLW